jgi:hypothetical protein
MLLLLLLLLLLSKWWGRAFEAHHEAHHECTTSRKHAWLAFNNFINVTIPFFSPIPEHIAIAVTHLPVTF